MTSKKFFIIDTMAMAFRNFHAFGQNQLRNSSGLPTSVVFGSLNFLLKLLAQEQPDYLVFATDTRVKTFRHELYAEYKANRTAMPEELAVQIPYLYEMIDILGTKTLRSTSLEADDLIGSMVRKFASADLHCYIVSGDKDFMQLVGDEIFLYTPQKGGEAKTIDRQAVFDKFRCAPSQVIDILAIMGDSSDNIPGVRGIGEKGAQQLVERFQSVEGIYQNLDAIANKKQRDALEAGRAQAQLCKQLVTIKTDADLPFQLNEFLCRPEEIMASRALLQFCQRMELTSLASRISGNLVKTHQSHVAIEPAIQVTEEPRSFDNYHAITIPEDFERLIRRLQQADHFCFDTETTGLDIIGDRPIGISFAVQPGEAFFIPMTPYPGALAAEAVADGLKSLFADPRKLKIGHNLKFDIQMLANLDVTVAGPFYDTMIMAHLLEASARSNNLDACCLRYLNYTKIALDSLINKKVPQAMLKVGLEDLARYASEDADLTLRLYLHLRPLLEAGELCTAAEKVEMPLIPVLARMERHGIYVDPLILEELSRQLDFMGQGLTRSIIELAGEDFNINSPKQLQVIMFEKLKIQEQLGMTRIKKTKSGYSTDVSVLEQLAQHPFADNLLKYRSVTKLKNTYVDTLPQLINPKTSRIHTSFHQTGTATGRLSSSTPNLQNIPIRSELGREIRLAFRAPTDNLCLVSADYSQIELRLLAHLAGERRLIEAFTRGEDIHTATAASILGISPDQVDKEQRAAAKTINFGIIYGMGANRLARETGMTIAKAKSFIDKYFATYPDIGAYIENTIAFAAKNEYTVTIMGRRRPLPEIKSRNKMEVAAAQNVATNTPVQGSAADLIKLAMVDIQKKLDESSLNVKMLLQVHDELVFECLKDDLAAAENLIRTSMESALALAVPLVVDIGHGANWLDAH